MSTRWNRRRPVAWCLAMLWVSSLAVALLFLIPAPVHAQVTITVNPAVTHQTWRGLGGNIPTIQPGASGCPFFTPAQMDTLLNELVNDLGMTRGRFEWDRSQNLELFANDNADPLSINLSAFLPAFTTPITWDNGCLATADDQLNRSVVPFRNKVTAAGQPVEVVMSFTNYHTVFNLMPLWWQTGSGSSGTGAQEASEAFHAVLLLLKQNYGFYPEFVTWNEPQSAGFWSSDASPGGSASWLGGWTVALHDRLAAAGIPTKIELPENSNGAGTLSYLSAIGLVPSALADLGRFTWHCYDCPSSSDFAGIVSLANSLGKETGMTETGDSTSYPGGQNMLHSLYLNATLGNVSVWHELAATDRCANAGCDAATTNGNWIVWEPDLSTYHKNPHYWVIRQFGHYVKPNYVRVDATSTNSSFESTAWKRPDGTLVVVIHVFQITGQTVQVNGLPPNKQFSVHQLDPSMCSNNAPIINRCAPTSITLTTKASGSLSLAMATDAIWTLEEPAAVATAVLTVSKSGTGTGTLTSNPAGINCGTTCSTSFATSTVVTVSAAPDANSTFTGWGGACAGTGTCSATMNSPQSVTAAFTLKSSPGDFSLSSTSSSSTISAGQTATFSMSVTPTGGFNQGVALTCSGAPQLSACTITPNSVTLNGSTSSTASVNVTTTAQASAPLLPVWRILPPVAGLRLPYWLLLSLAGTLLTLGGLRHLRHRSARFGGLFLGISLLAMAFAVTLTGCTASTGAGVGGVGRAGTPAGTYSITITGTSGSLNHTAVVTLTVK